MANFEEDKLSPNDLELFVCTATINRRGDLEFEINEAVQPACATALKCVHKSRTYEIWRMNVWGEDARDAYDLFDAYCSVALAEHEWMPQPRKSLPEEDIFG